MIIALILGWFINQALHVRLLAYVYAQRYFTILFGVLIALMQNSHTRALKKLKSLIEQHITVTKFIAIPTLLGLLWTFPSFTPDTFFNGLGFVLAGILAAAVVFVASFEKNIVLNFPIINKVLEYIGSRSYSIYLCHFPFIRLRPTIITLYDMQLPEWFKTGQIGLSIQYILIWLAMIISSEIAFRLIEKPFINLGNAYIAQWKLNRKSAY